MAARRCGRGLAGGGCGHAPTLSAPAVDRERPARRRRDQYLARRWRRRHREELVGRVRRGDRRAATSTRALALWSEDAAIVAAGRLARRRAATAIRAGAARRSLEQRRSRCEIELAGLVRAPATSRSRRGSLTLRGNGATAPSSSAATRSSSTRRGAGRPLADRARRALGAAENLRDDHGARRPMAARRGRRITQRSRPS